MRHNYFGKKLSRTKNERRRLFMILLKDLFHHGQIKTTLAKAKAVAPLVEKLITRAKKGGNNALFAVEKVIANRQIAKEIISDSQSRFGQRTSGYTRIIKLGSRLGDASEEVLLSLVDTKMPTEIVAPKKIEEVKTDKPKTIKKSVKKSVKTK